MAAADDRSHIPWSIKGVSRAARQRAKEEAARDGLTMGDWLTRRIHLYAEVAGMMKEGQG